MAKKIFIVTHPKLYMKVKGKTVLMPKDTELSMEPKDAKSLIKQGKILVKGEGKKVEVGTKELTKAEQKKLKAEAKKLADAENDGEETEELSN